VLAGAAGVFRDVARQQVDIVAQQAAHLVLGVVGFGQFLGQVERGGAAQRPSAAGRRRRFVRPARLPGRPSGADGSSPLTSTRNSSLRRRSMLWVIATSR
jgi:hypothetical protein